MQFEKTADGTVHLWSATLSPEEQILRIELNTYTAAKESSALFIDALTFMARGGCLSKCKSAILATYRCCLLYRGDCPTQLDYEASIPSRYEWLFACGRQVFYQPTERDPVEVELHPYMAISFVWIIFYRNQPSLEAMESKDIIPTAMIAPAKVTELARGLNTTVRTL